MVAHSLLIFVVFIAVYVRSIVWCEMWFNERELVLSQNPKK